MASSFQVAASGVISVFNTEFAAEGFKLIPDKPHDSLGFERVVAGVYPTEDVVQLGNALVQETYLEVKFLGLWDKQINPDQVVNPFIVTGYAERLKKALRAVSITDPQSNEMWYFQVLRTTYPDDPTGNKSRFIMSLRAYGDNPALLETRL